MRELPESLIEAVVYFADEQVAFDYMVGQRWPDGVCCPRCASNKVHLIETRRVWRCNGCKRQFSVKVGTIFEDSPISLSKWLPAMWLIANAKNGVSSCELARALDVTQKTAWFMLHRIRMAMQNGTFEVLKGHVEADETFVGGKAINMHHEKRVSQYRDGGKGKTLVVGALQRGGNVKVQVVERRDRKTIKAFLLEHVHGYATLFTDTHSAYTPMGFYFQHLSVNHAFEWAKGKVHTNGMENFWSLLKRSIKGTYVCPSPWHLHRYCDEQEFRFNLRRGTDYDRFSQVASLVSGKRLTYAELTGKELGYLG